ELGIVSLDGCFPHPGWPTIRCQTGGVRCNRILLGGTPLVSVPCWDEGDNPKKHAHPLRCVQEAMKSMKLFTMMGSGVAVALLASNVLVQEVNAQASAGGG